MVSSEKYLKIANKVVDAAADYLIKKFGSIKTMSHKEGSHYGIREDIECNRLYEKLLTRYTPEFSLYTEEGKKSLENEYVWVVDPIEGTSNYSVGNPFFATQICLLSRKEPVISVVYAPLLKQRFIATKGGGAFLNNNQVFVDILEDMKRAVLVVGKGTNPQDTDWYIDTIAKVLKSVRTVRNFGSCGLEMSYVASGKLDIYLNHGSQIYDCAPGVLMIREGGGKVLNYRGEEWSLKDKDLIAANKTLVNKVLRII